MKRYSYNALAVAWKAHERRVFERQLAGWKAYQMGVDLHDRPRGDIHWTTGWNTASGSGPCPEPRKSQLCPGVAQRPKHVGPDEKHIAGRLEWACAGCGWRICLSDDVKKEPAYVPIHSGPMRGADKASPICGAGPHDLMAEAERD